MGNTQQTYTVETLTKETKQITCNQDELFEKLQQIEPHLEERTYQLQSKNHIKICLKKQHYILQNIQENVEKILNEQTLHKRVEWNLEKIEKKVKLCEEQFNTVNQKIGMISDQIEGLKIQSKINEKQQNNQI